MFDGEGVTFEPFSETDQRTTRSSAPIKPTISNYVFALILFGTNPINVGPMDVLILALQMFLKQSGVLIYQTCL